MVISIRQFGFIVIGVLILVLNSCTNSWVPLSVDTALGDQARHEIERNRDQFRILSPENHAFAYKKLDSIRNTILNSGKLKHRNNFDWDIHLVDDDSVLNAFCVPGGHIYVFTGLIRYLDSEDALAGVLGHEMAHADARHAINQLVKNMGLSLIIRFVLGIDNSTLVSLGANLLSLSFSRSDETEADLKSVEYLYETQYDARGAGKFFEKLRKDKNLPEIPEFISTHPDPGNREDRIQEHWLKLGGKTGETDSIGYQILIQSLGERTW